MSVTTGPSRQAWWFLVGLVLLAHAVALGLWWQQRVDAVPAGAPMAPAPAAVATATELGSIRIAPPPTSAPPKKNEEKRPPALSVKESLAIKSIPPPAIQSTPVPATPSVTAESVAASTTAVTTAASPEVADKADSAVADATTTPPGALKWPAPVELRFDVQATRKGLSLSADSVLRWQPGATDYQARLEVKALLLGQRSQTSVGTLDPVSGLQPTRYGDKSRSEQATHFDRSRSPPTLRFSANTPDLPLQPHTQDRLSVLLQLAAMFAGEPGRFGPGDTLALHTAGPRDADVWQFKVGDTARLALPVGTLDTVHLARAPQHTYDNRVELWLAPSLGYVPVRILWTQANGDVVDQRLASHRPLVAP